MKIIKLKLILAEHPISNNKKHSTKDYKGYVVYIHASPLSRRTKNASRKSEVEIRSEKQNPSGKRLNWIHLESKLTWRFKQQIQTTELETEVATMKDQTWRAIPLRFEITVKKKKKKKKVVGWRNGEIKERERKKEGWFAFRDGNHIIHSQTVAEPFYFLFYFLCLTIIPLLCSLMGRILWLIILGFMVINYDETCQPKTTPLHLSRGSYISFPYLIYLFIV